MQQMQESETELGSEEEKTSVDKRFDELLKTVHKYGEANDYNYEVEIKPCLRVRKIKQYRVNGYKCRSYTVGFMKEYGYHPNESDGDSDTDSDDVSNSDEKLEISHECANPRNKKQSLCIEGSHMILETHDKNQKRRICHNYIRKYWNKYRNNENCTTTGCLTVAIVNNELSELYPTEDFNFRCKCDTDCFINFGKL